MSPVREEKEDDHPTDRSYSLFSDTEDEEDLFESNTFQLYIPRGEMSPYVDIDIEGVLTTFVVDTGALVTTVTQEQVRLWGVQDKCVYDPDCPERGGRVRVLVLLKKHPCNITIGVDNVLTNLLGLDILKRFCCIIDLDQFLLTFRW